MAKIYDTSNQVKQYIFTFDTNKLEGRLRLRVFESHRIEVNAHNFKEAVAVAHDQLAVKLKFINEQPDGRLVGMPEDYDVTEVLID